MGVARVVRIVLVSHLLYLQSGYTQKVCTEGWFGSSCQYKCRCESNQCDVNGTCTSSSKCQKGWFGPACQYENIVALDTTSLASHLITDGDDTTCNDVKQLSNMKTTWSETYVFSWLRLRVSHPDVFYQINVSITNNGSESTCADLTRVVIEKQTLDIHCPSCVLMNKLELKGNGVKYLCSLYVSGGRNVAIRQTTNQSSTYADDRTTLSYTKSENAVDGNTSGLFDEQTCTHTKYELHPTWNLFLTASKLVNRYVIYNRAGMNNFRLQGFVLESFDNNGKMVFQYNNSSKIQNIYQIIDSDIGQQVVQVQIYFNRTGYLTLCEVELYGDSVCQHGHYGRDCEYTCNCDVISEACFVSNGGCPSGCPFGFYGEGCRKACDTGRFGKGCTQMCSYQCAKIACGAADGVCVDGCRQGYKPPYCNEECDPGFHGFNCTEPCSKNCNGTCDRKDGFCLHGCLPGYLGQQCDKVFLVQADVDSSSPVAVIVGQLIAFVVLVRLIVIGVFVRRKCRHIKYGSREPFPDRFQETESRRDPVEPAVVTAAADTTVTTKAMPAVTKNPQLSLVAKDSQKHPVGGDYYNFVPAFSETYIAFRDNLIADHRHELHQEQLNCVPANSSALATETSITQSHNKCRNENACDDEGYEISDVSATPTQKARQLSSDDNVTSEYYIMANPNVDIADNEAHIYELIIDDNIPDTDASIIDDTLDNAYDDTVL